MTSLVSRPHAPPGEKWSGERSRISWAYYPNVVMTNEIARLVILLRSTSLTTVKFVDLHSSIHTFFGAGVLNVALLQECALAQEI